MNKKIFVIIGYFHQVCVGQKMFKRRKYLKHNDSFVDSSVAPGSVEKALSGYHYYWWRCWYMGLLKRIIAVGQYRVDQLVKWIRMYITNLPSDKFETVGNC